MLHQPLPYDLGLITHDHHRLVFPGIQDVLDQCPPTEF
jgi:hypothetical protein